MIVPLKELCDKHPIPSGISFTYGTAGFRTLASHLDGVAFRMGIFGALRAQFLGQNVGICITASHNSAVDNGLKIIDGSGEMLAASWEPLATLLANAESAADIASVVQKLCTDCNIDIQAKKTDCRVLIAHDTRPTGPSLAKSAADGCRSVGHAFQILGLQTTPQCHFCVRESNLRPQVNVMELAEQYKTGMVVAFQQLLSGTDKLEDVRIGAEVLVDCANGVGTVILQDVKQQLANTICISSFNDDTNTAEVLNHNCGADYVQKEQCAPSNTPDVDAKVHLSSVDGDADRVVFFQNNPFRLLDGDKIVTLCAIFIKKQLDILNLHPPDISIGVVQTAYANGGSTSYINTVLQLPTTCTPTGVKHLHHKALEYDIGLYFEANGHGTILFSPKVVSLVEGFDCTTEEQRKAKTRLLACVKLLHPTVGDAIADALMVEGCLHALGWDLDQWQAVYQDLPSRQSKVPVPDPRQVTTVWDETKVLSPPGLQEEIDSCVAKYNALNQARAFVRPSGTEPIVRIYAEASTQTDADALAADVAEVLIKLLAWHRI